MALIDRSLELNPSFAQGWARSGWIRLWAGQPDGAIEHFGTSMRLNPRDRRADLLLGIGVGHFFARRFDQAEAALLLSLEEIATWVPTYRFLASCRAHMGRLEEAREMIKRLQTMTPIVVPNAMHWRNPEHRELYLKGLRMAATEAR
jgi:adenylate cyclase